MNESVAQQALIKTISAIDLKSACWDKAMLTEHHYRMLLTQDIATTDHPTHLFGVLDLRRALYKAQVDIAQSENHVTWRYDYEGMGRILTVGLLGLRAIIKPLNKMFSIGGSFDAEGFDALIDLFRKQGIETLGNYLIHREAAESYLKAIRELSDSITMLFFPGPLGLKASATRYQTAVRENFNDVVKSASAWLSSFDIRPNRLSQYPTIGLDVIGIQLQHADQLVWEVLPESTDDHAVRGAILFAECIPVINELYDKGMFKTENIPSLFKSLL